MARMSEAARTRPLEITRVRDHDVRILWQDGHESHYPARTLRLSCRCAVCVEEMSGKPLINPGSVPADVIPQSLQLVGSYAIQILWSDGHSTGIYTFDHLRAICPCPVCRTEAP